MGRVLACRAPESTFTAAPQTRFLSSAARPAVWTDPGLPGLPEAAQTPRPCYVSSTDWGGEPETLKLLDTKPGLRRQQFTILPEANKGLLRMFTNQDVF